MIELPNDFFTHYWQKKPCLIQAGTAWRPEITPEELAGIACEPESRARIIHEYPQKKGANRWAEQEGPFNDQLFQHLPTSHWTLLVQEVDRWDDQVAQLLQVPVIPKWRIEDIMVSYAVDQGSVGPHFDHYDVFLVQGMGYRTWKIAGQCVHEQPLPHDDLLLLQEMQVLEEFKVGPGDIVYIPPGIGHWGIANGPCMTFSIGFRAPSVVDTLQALSDRMCPASFAHHRYQDSTALLHYHQANDRPHELAAPAINQFRQLINQTLTDELILQWLGCRATAQEQHQPFIEVLSAADFAALWAIGLFEKQPHNIMLWSQNNGQTVLFCNGLDITFSTGLEPAQEAVYLETLCKGSHINVNQPPLQGVACTRQIVQWLLEQEAIVPSKES